MAEKKQNLENFLGILKETQELVWPEINKYLSSSPKKLYCLSKKEISNYKGFIDFQYKMVNEYPSRKGKYFRPTLVLLMAEILGVKKDTAKKTAAAMQLSEEWLLIQDDFEDDSLKRRGRPCLHRMYSPEYAVNASTTLFLIMWRILSDNEKVIGYKKSAKIQKEIQNFLLRATLGQTIEIRATKKNSFLGKKDVIFIMKGKTGYYTVGGPLRLGAILGGANNNLLKGLLKFGKALGVCYQIQDDILDLVGNFGGRKIQYNDIYEGKKTLMLSHLKKTAHYREKKTLEKIFEKSRNEKTVEDIELIISLMKKYKSIDYAKNVAIHYRKKCKRIMNEYFYKFPSSAAKMKLNLAIDFVLDRHF